ncbi:ribonuclease catalytic domain-containing protein [Desulfosoma caldarium]|uniref:Exoribonuclease-2 n=1 Tax=Desulfosoma caldarium TaxID=610254 RepID=A0A3N1UVC6_9BACT|nr:ribonuclease catalytic domain-containing protein [Desulfosoma caldarium]ROQ91116.1 exoribonuclease-2 [Desulfosoma caldarium]
MSPFELSKVSPGTVVEFFEAKELLLGVCLTVKDQKLHVLTEANREMSLVLRRVVSASPNKLNPAQSRDDLVRALKSLRNVRETLAAQVNVAELWSVLEGESEAYGPKDLADLVFASGVTDDHVAAVQRALLADRLYFQFKDGLFAARTAEQVERRREEMAREAERVRLLEEGAQWARRVWQAKSGGRHDIVDPKVLEKIKDFGIFGQESESAAFVKELFGRAGIPVQPASAFRLLVRLGVWSEDENLYLHQQGLSLEFPEKALDAAERAKKLAERIWTGEDRSDFRSLDVFTIDSASTRDFDDALSFRPLGQGLWEVGVHIADAAHFVDLHDVLDQEAASRVTSIYLPDRRIPMLPSALSEEACSLCLGKDRATLSFIMEVDAAGQIHRCSIRPGIVRVTRRLTYEQVDGLVETEEAFKVLWHLSERLREQRRERGAVLLPLPEIHISVNDHGMIQLIRYDKERPSQIIVSEWMIAANARAAAYLAEHNVPAIYRCQAECRPETDQVQSDYPIFHIYRQRRLFARAELETRPGPHCSLGTNPYTTVTSPIRRYIDLVVQRQIKAALCDGRPVYGEEDLEKILTHVRVQLSKIAFVQRKWTRYWILRYLEQEDIQTVHAIVLDKNAKFAYLLLPDFLLEVQAPLPSDHPVGAGEMVRLKIERLHPRDDVLRVQIV